MSIVEVSFGDSVTFGDTAEALELDEFVQALFHKTKQLVLNRSEVAARERALFAHECRKFEKGFSEILRIEDKRSRELALEIAASALSLGYYHSGYPSVIEELKKEFQQARTKAAHEVRGRADIQQVVEKHVRDVLEKKPEIRDKPTEIAKLIVHRVVNDVKALKDSPRQWIETDLRNADCMKAAIDRVRSRVSDVLTAMNDKNPSLSG